jgi:hypothetical protein
MERGSFQGMPTPVYLLYFRFTICVLGRRHAFFSSPAVLRPLELDLLGGAFSRFLYFLSSGTLSV